MLAPICLFTYNRLTETKQTVEALKKNFLAAETELFVFSDAAKAGANPQKVNDVREFLKTIVGFKKIEIIESSVNKGLANSIIQGVTHIISIYEKVIVLEDDLVTTPNFLNFMNQALDFYALNNRIFSISGYSMDLPGLKSYQNDFYYSYRASSWGWGTWKDRWEKVDWQMKNYQQFKWNLPAQIRFMRGGSDLPYMLWKQMHGKIDSWAVRWCYNQFKNNQLTVLAAISKLESVGFGSAATHTKSTKRFFVTADKAQKTEFTFSSETKINRRLSRNFRHKFSVFARLMDRF